MVLRKLWLEDTYAGSKLGVQQKTAEEEMILNFPLKLIIIYIFYMMI